MPTNAQHRNCESFNGDGDGRMNSISVPCRAGTKRGSCFKRNHFLTSLLIVKHKINRNTLTSLLNSHNKMFFMSQIARLSRHLVAHSKRNVWMPNLSWSENTAFDASVKSGECNMLLPNFERQRVPFLHLTQRIPRESLKELPCCVECSVMDSLPMMNLNWISSFS